MRPVKLWLDDIEELHRVLSSDGTEPVEIVVDNHQADSIEDLAQLPGRDRISELSLRRQVSGKPPIEVVIKRSGQYVNVYSADNEALGVFHQLLAIMRNRARPLTRHMTPYAVGFLVALIVGLAVLGAGLRLETEPALVLIVATVLAWGVLILAYFRLERSMVWHTRRAAAPSFWKRNRDALAVNTMTAAVGVIAGYILNEWT